MSILPLAFSSFIGDLSALWSLPVSFMVKSLSDRAKSLIALVLGAVVVVTGLLVKFGFFPPSSMTNLQNEQV